jgi:hypothetical protein
MTDGRRPEKNREQFWDHSRWTGHDELDDEVRGRLTQVKSRQVLREHQRPVPDPEFSGLLDIRSLAHATRAELQVDGNAITLTGLPSAAATPPVLPARPTGIGTEIKIGMGALAVGAVVLLALLAVLAFRGGDQPADPAAGGPPQLTALMLAAVDPPTEEAPPTALLDRATTTARQEEQPAAAPRAADARPNKVVRGKKQRNRHERRKLWQRTELDALLGNALESRARAKPAKRRNDDRNDDRPATLSRAEVSAGLGRVGKRVQQKCGKDRDGVVTVQIVIGRNGRVARARPVGAQAGTGTGKCVARAARKARFPRFSGQPITVKYPFRL